MTDGWERDAPGRGSRLTAIGLALTVVGLAALLVRPGGAGSAPGAGLLDIMADEQSAGPPGGPTAAADLAPGAASEVATRPRIARVPGASPAPSPRRDRESLAARWEAGAAAPPAVAAIGATAWDGTDRLFVVGGSAYDPDTGRTTFLTSAAVYSLAGGSWAELPPPPLEPRADAAATWTGEELVVWGGISATGHLDDGAAFDPASGRWRMLSPSPLSPRGGAAAVSWTGAGVLIAGGAYNRRGLEDTAIWLPDRDAWVTGPALPEASGRSAHRVELTSGAAAGSGPLLSFPSHHSSTAPPVRIRGPFWQRTDPGRVLDDPQEREEILAAVTALDDGSFVGLRTGYGLAGAEGRLLRLAVGADQWEPLTDDVVHRVDNPVAAMAAGRHYVAVGSSGRTLAFDLDRDAWLELPFGPADHHPGSRRVVGLDDGVLLLTSAIGTGPTVVIHRLRIDDRGD